MKFLWNSENSYIEFVSQGQDYQKNRGGGGSKSLRMSFLEAVYGFRVSFFRFRVHFNFQPQPPPPSYFSWSHVMSNFYVEGFA